jgi:hypothetical protein
MSGDGCAAMFPMPPSRRDGSVMTEPFSFPVAAGLPHPDSYRMRSFRRRLRP